MNGSASARRLCQRKNSSFMKCFYLCSKQGKVSRGQPASGLAKSLRCRGVIGLMILPAIAGLSEPDDLSPGRVRPPHGRNGRAAVFERAAGRRGEAKRCQNAQPEWGASHESGYKPAEELTRSDDRSSHPPSISPAVRDESFWAHLVFRCVRAVHGSAIHSGTAGSATAKTTSILRPKRSVPMGKCPPEPTEQSLQALLSEMAYHHVRALATAGENGNEHCEDSEHTP